MINYLKSSAIENFIFILFLGCMLRFKFFAAQHLYIFLVIFFLFFFIFLFNYNYGFFSKKNIYLFLFFLIIATCSFFFSSNISDNNIIYYCLFYTLPILYYSSALSFFKKISKEQMVHLFDKGMHFFIIYLFVEVFFRYYISYKLFKEQGLFLAFDNFKFFKINSFYSDTNFLALVIQNFALVNLFLYETEKNKKYLRVYLLLFVFMFLTLSRSVLLTQIFLFIFKYYIQVYKKGYFIRFIILTLTGFYLIIVLFFLLQYDASFRSKVAIIRSLSMIKNFSTGDILFGFGFGKGDYIYSAMEGGYAHSHIALLLGQIGVVGALLFVCFLIFVDISSLWATNSLIFVFLVSGVSLAFFDTSFYLCLSFITAFTMKHKRLTTYENRIYNT